jgi:hypothetical protein
VVLGSMMPTMVTIRPKRPSSQAVGPAPMPPPALSPTFQPISATNSTLGPGAAWAMATDELNCASVSQPCWATR